MNISLGRLTSDLEGTWSHQADTANASTTIQQTDRSSEADSHGTTKPTDIPKVCDNYQNESNNKMGMFIGICMYL